jgi:hypothetical protein
VNGVSTYRTGETVERDYVEIAEMNVDPARQKTSEIGRGLRCLALIAVFSMSLNSAYGQEGGQVASDGVAYKVTGLELDFVYPHPELPTVEELLALEVHLGGVHARRDLADRRATLLRHGGEGDQPADPLDDQ